jgi:hypothetical protein
MRYGEFCSILDKLFPASFNFEFNLSYVQVIFYYFFNVNVILRSIQYDYSFTLKDICYVEEPYVYYLNVLDLPDEIEKR